MAIILVFHQQPLSVEFTETYLLHEIALSLCISQDMRRLGLDLAHRLGVAGFSTKVLVYRHICHVMMDVDCVL